MTPVSVDASSETTPRREEGPTLVRVPGDVNSGKSRVTGKGMTKFKWLESAHSLNPDPPSVEGSVADGGVANPLLVHGGKSSFPAEDQSSLKRFFKDTVGRFDGYCRGGSPLNKDANLFIDCKRKQSISQYREQIMKGHLPRGRSINDDSLLFANDQLPSFK